MSNNTTKVNNPMKVITGKDTRWSYANVWEAKSINGGAPKFSVSIIIPKSELPLGILVAAIGAPCFVYLLVRKSYGFGEGKS